MKKITLVLIAATIIGGSQVAGCYMDCKNETSSPSLSNLKKWQGYLKVRTADPSEPIGTTETQISNVSPELALGKMNQALETYDADLQYRLSTVFHIAEQDESKNSAPAITAIAVKGHLYYVAALDYPVNRSNHSAYEQTGGKIPAIVVVDAEDETKPAWVRTADEKGNAYAIKIYHGTQAAVDDNNILRHLRNHGYSTAVGSHSLDDPTLELDDDWRPYYTVTYNNDDGYGQFGTAIWPETLLVVDAQTGELKPYALDDPNTPDKNERDPAIPTWIDQIYSPAIVLDWIAKWGYNPANYGKTSDVNTFALDGQHLDQVMDRANKNIVFVSYLTSTHPDNSLIGVMLVDPHTGTATLYNTKGPQRAMGSKTTAINNILQATHRWDYRVDALSLHTIFGVETWQGVLSRPSYMDQGGEFHASSAKEYGSLYCGTVLLKADADHKPANVIWATSKQEALTKYERHLYLSRTTRVGSNVLEDKELTANVAKVTPYVQDGNTSYLIYLEGHPREVYEVPILFIGDHNTEDAFALEPGDTVYLHYADPVNQKTLLVREVKRIPGTLATFLSSAPASTPKAPPQKTPPRAVK